MFGKGAQQMVLNSNGKYSIFDPTIRKQLFGILFLIVLFCVVLFFVPSLILVAVILMPVASTVAVAVITSSKNQKYVLQDKKISFWKTYYIKDSIYAGSSSRHRRMSVHIVVSGLTKIYFEQSRYEKKRNIGRIYFIGSPKVESDSPLTADEKMTIIPPYFYTLYGIENFSQTTQALRDLLPPEKFTDKNPISYKKAKKKKDDSPFLQP